MPKRRREPSLRRPVRVFVVAVSVFGGLLMVAGGVYAAQQFAGQTSPEAPVKIMPDEQKTDRVLVIASDPGTDWSQLTIESDSPARVAIGGQVLTVGPVPLPMPPGIVVPGQTLRACSVAGTGEVELVLRQMGGGLVSVETLHVPDCGLTFGT